ncbi:acetyl esterase/lipase [Nonomuraea dietziae]|uniref:Acetyl esterase/lipase n=1 Tax=Nonomuraea dietziae TaxID=65515 RepID=A0A7W5V2A9_9ACTN|nr:acetyl esterase/lipase [Nonomuraea dietziae]
MTAWPNSPSISPEAKYPTVIEQNYAAAQWVVNKGAEKGLDGSRMVVAGDSVGGNMAAVLAIMAKERGDVGLDDLRGPPPAMVLNRRGRRAVRRGRGPRQQAA